MPSLHEIVGRLGVPVANHLLQSTLFGFVATGTVLTLKTNEARLRFWIWFLGSAKFLLPFAPLLTLGATMAKPLAGVHPKTFATTVEIVNLPRAVPASDLMDGLLKWNTLERIAPTLLMTLWCLGSLSVVSVRARQWLYALRLKRAATPLTSGREVVQLRSLLSAAGSHELTIWATRDRIEPGIFGILKPVLLWPCHLSDELDDLQLAAVLTHEIWHARRRDNLTAAIQMAIEAIFWFHPLIWWFGSRQLEERERACDEGVLGLGSDPGIYAESILKTCRFCMQVQLPAVAGVGGSHLKQRITRILEMQNMTVLSRTKKFLLGSLTATALLAPFALGIASTPPGGAQINEAPGTSGSLGRVVVKLNSSGSLMTQVKHVGDETRIINTTTKNLIEMAYSLKEYQLTGGPDWLNSERFDVAFSGGATGPLNGVASNTALQEILAQKFHLVLRQETKPGKILALVVGAGGIKFLSTTPANAPGTNEPLLSMRVFQKDGQGQIAIIGGLGGLADALSAQIGRPVVDKTDLKGTYDIHFHWTATSATTESIAAALQEQLGLTLVPEESPIETSVVDSITIPPSH